MEMGFALLSYIGRRDAEYNIAKWIAQRKYSSSEVEKREKKKGTEECGYKRKPHSIRWSTST